MNNHKIKCLRAKAYAKDSRLSGKLESVARGQMGLWLGTGLAIVALTLLLRTALLPISWRIAFRGAIRQKKRLRRQPELVSIKAKYGDDPQLYAQRMMKLYQEHGVTVMDPYRARIFGSRCWRGLPRRS